MSKFILLEYNAESAMRLISFIAKVSSIASLGLVEDDEVLAAHVAPYDLEAIKQEIKVKFPLCYTREEYDFKFFQSDKKVLMYKLVVTKAGRAYAMTSR